MSIPARTDDKTVRYRGARHHVSEWARSVKAPHASQFRRSQKTVLDLSRHVPGGQGRRRHQLSGFVGQIVGQVCKVLVPWDWYGIAVSGNVFGAEICRP